MMMQTTNIETVKRKKESYLKTLREKMFNDLNLGFEGVED
jgi:hypothetical protein